MSELAWFLAPVGSLLWMAGGTWWKPARRYVYPILMFLGCFSGGHAGRLVGWMLSTMAMTSLGYGDSASWGRRAWVSLAYGATLLWFGWDALWWAIFLSLGFFFLLWAARKWNALPWKLCECLMGFAHALGTVWLTSHA